MFTRRHEGLVVQAESAGQGRAAVVAAVLFGAVATAIRATKGLDAAPRGAVRVDATTGDLGRALLGAHVLAFEVVSVLLLGAIIGAIVIARKRDPVAAPRARRTSPSSSSASEVAQ
jgi:NADH-quinone oxidoreductase subunit J